jgi:hypothetical protein
MQVSKIEATNAHQHQQQQQQQQQTVQKRHTSPHHLRSTAMLTPETIITPQTIINCGDCTAVTSKPPTKTP